MDLINIHILLITIFFITLIFHSVILNNVYNVIENMKNKNKEDYNLILLGDSILNNENYVSNRDTVYSNLKSQYKKCYIYAEDNAVINDINNQYDMIPKKLKNKDSIFVISVGGNDLLNSYNYLMINKKDNKYFDSIWNEYKKTIIDLNNSKNKSKIAILNIYYPKDEEYKKYYPLIEKWNKRVKKLCIKEKMIYISIEKDVYKKSHFIDSIEPSSESSKIIADIIIDNTIS